MPHPNEFFSSEFIIKLYRDMRNVELDTKIQFLFEYIETVKEQYTPDLVDYLKKGQLSLFYFDHQQYENALPLFEEIATREAPKGTSGNHMYALLLIRTHRLLKNYPAAFSILEEKLVSNKKKLSGFETLDLLGDYLHLCEDTAWFFDPKFEPAIQFVIEELGFQEKKLEPMDQIKFLTSTHQDWNKRLGEIHLKKDISNEIKIKMFEIYQEECTIGWYRDYAGKTIINLRNQKPE